MTSERPRGREDVTEAILRSARRLVAKRGPSVGLREIADNAGVNFGLLYHYLGTKEQLLDEIYRRAAENAAADFTELGHLAEALGRLMTLGDGTVGRLITWAALEGSDLTDHISESPGMAALAALLQADATSTGRVVTDEDARVFAALAMTITIGWRILGPTALRAAGLTGTPDTYANTIQTYIERFAHAVVASDGSRL